MNSSKSDAATGKHVSRGEPSGSPRGDSSREARRVAILMLEVLGGVRTPFEAATEMGISEAQYHILEKRGLEGLVAACEPRGRGPVPSLEKEMAKLRKKCEKLEHECMRYQALHRVAQRTMRIAAPPSPNSKAKSKGTRGRKRKRAVRALRAAQRLKQGTPSHVTETSAATRQGEAQHSAPRGLSDQEAGG